MQTGSIKNSNHTPPYIGRFAPSPTGPLHFGSVVAALGSYLQARNRQGRWYVRMEDIDIPRIQPGAADAILHGLEALGLFWDGDIVFQSQREASYKEAISRLAENDMIYGCICTRKDVAGKRYPGTCRKYIPPGKKARSYRVLTNADEIQFHDGIQGRFKQNIEDEVGDFIIRRVEGSTAYHLAVVIDDAWQGVTEIVRGFDLLDSTPRQIYLQRLLDLPTPEYIHLPVAVNAQGRKISKQNHAEAVLIEHPVPVLHNALKFLGQEPVDELTEGNIEDVIQWGIDHWSLAKIPRCTTIEVTED
ncbi:MAG: tRNA glutamyl-Q(34) synthetase GluQRS [Gammaproteobacteria bacterium]